MTIVGEHDYRGAGHLIAREAIELERRSRRSSPIPSRWPSARASCASSCREVERRSVSSTAAAVRMVSESARPLGGARGARGGRRSTAATILREGVEDEADNVTRFVWIAPAGTEPRRRRRAGRPRWSSPSSARTTPARWSTRCASSPSRGVNLTPDRVAAAAPGPRPLHVLLRPRGRRGRRAGRRGDRGAAHEGRIGADPRLLSRRLSRSFRSARAPRA